MFAYCHFCSEDEKSRLEYFSTDVFSLLSPPLYTMYDEPPLYTMYDEPPLYTMYTTIYDEKP